MEMEDHQLSMDFFLGKKRRKNGSEVEGRALLWKTLARSPC
jgi:hypothetical protein